MKRKQRKPATPRGRTRGIPHMIYLSEDESAKFRAKAAARGRTLSDQCAFGSTRSRAASQRLQP